MATTSPDNLRSPEPGSNFDPVLDIQNLAADAQAALNTKVSKGEIDEVIPATTSAAGVVIRATQAEVSAGTNTSKYVTPQTARNVNYLPFAMAVGAHTGGNILNNGSGTTITITFPANRFTRAPHILATPTSAARLTVARIAVSTTSATVRVDNFSGAAAAAGWGFAWQGIQMASGSASG